MKFPDIEEILSRDPPITAGKWGPTLEMPLEDLIAYIGHAWWCRGQLARKQTWNLEPSEAQLESIKNGLDSFIANPRTTPEELHVNWMAYKLANGWQYGETKNVTAKIHPRLRDWNDLPVEERQKDTEAMMGWVYALGVVGLLSWDEANEILDRMDSSWQ